MNAANQSVLKAQIQHKLDSQREYHDYAYQMQREAMALIKELFPIGSIVVSDNGTISVVCGVNDDQLSVCNVGSTNSGWTHYLNVNHK